MTARPTRPRPTWLLPRCPGRQESERRACARPDLSMHYDVDGRFQLRYSAPAPIGALVEQALKEAKDSLFLAASGSGEGEAAAAARTDSHGIAATDRPTYADALEELAQRSLSSVTSTGRASHYRVYLHLSTDGAWVNGGGAIPRRLLDRFVSRRRGPAGVGDRGTAGQRGSVDADPAAPLPSADRGPRPRLPLPRLHGHPVRRDPPPPRVGGRRRDRRRQPGEPLPVPPRRHRPGRLHHRG